MMLAPHHPSAYPSPVAAHQRRGLGGPESVGGHRLSAVFLCPQHGKPVMGGPCGSPSGLPVATGRSANLHGSALPAWRQGCGNSNRTVEAPAMTPRHPLALNPSTRRARANRHRRLAFAALKLDSSLSVRLSRYWQHIATARALEAQEVAK